MSLKLYAVVVLYNTSITNSITCVNLSKISGHDITTIVIDNSTKDNNNKFLAVREGIEYISMHGNAGLPKAYNHVLDYLTGKEGIVIWFDDDTNVTQKFFDELVSKAELYPKVDIFTPIIEGQDGKFWSPNKARFFKNKQLTNVNDKIRDEEYNAINSCTASRLRVFKNYRYDERLFLDQVDHSFCRDQRELHRKFCKLNCIIHHNFSTKDIMPSLKDVQKRYSIMIPDFLTYCNTDSKHLRLGYIKVIGWGVRESLKYKHIKFMSWFISQINVWKRNNYY
ncbi:glycosyltransferase [Limosilactobacillus fermentum]|uniref:glycosyltransferase n=1 Tax=Limosilactobacillus fermentum TaxID=1613 RepID=UPI001965231C|nr:glycosyltransferase [Limosilactobacillus fermentum]MBM9561370.1 glycosyltransferase [Limosilactobacillus fermentum]